MPAPRLVRAADRFAVWHEAADDDAVVPPGYDPVAPEDIVAPDGGDLTPDGAITMGGPELEPAVVIPNSNKFKTPANGLKKLLETKVWGADESPSLGMPEHSSPNVKDWIDKHPAFAKTYFKPSYQDALKASLGDANYKKLLYHMPKEHHQALTTHVQHPAPNSNKFKTPANGLSKLLHNPETTPEHVQAWVDLTVHAPGGRSRAAVRHGDGLGSARRREVRHAHAPGESPTPPAQAPSGGLRRPPRGHRGPQATRHRHRA